MSESIYVFSKGELKRKQNTVYFKSELGDYKYIPVENTRELHLFGGVSLNKDALEFFIQNEIILHFYNYYGYYVGSYYPREHYNSGYMLLKQAEHYLDTTKRLILAYKFANGSVCNIRKVLSYYLNRDVDLEIQIRKIEELATLLKNQKDPESLMAIEGNIRETYYSSFDIIIDNENFKMGKRTKRPPRNRLNVLISFSNSLLYACILSEIYKTHLDPRIGFLHATNFRGFSLNLDVAEIFKPIMVDRIIFHLLNKNMINADDFDKHLEGIYLKESGRKILIEKIEEKMRSTVKYRKIGREISYRRLIRLELYKLEKHLSGDEEYEPLVAEW